MTDQHQFHLLFTLPACVPAVTSSTWSLIRRDKVVTWTEVTFYSQHFIAPYIFSAFEHCCLRVAWHLRCGFSSHGNIFHSNRSHWLARCLHVDHFWPVTNVTVLKMTTFIFNRAWQVKWKWKHRNSSIGKDQRTNHQDFLPCHIGDFSWCLESEMQYMSTSWNTN